MLHVRHRGQSHEIPFEDLRVTPANTDPEIKAAVASHLDVVEGEFASYVLEREATGEMTLRPEAVFGRGSDRVS